MVTSARHDEPGLFARAIDWIRDYRARQRELGALSHDDMTSMASDLGLSASDLRDVLSRGADNTVLMDRMLEMRGLCPEEVRLSLAPWVRDLELTCSRCSATRRCRRELQAGTAAEHAHDFCPNANTIDGMLEEAASRG